jgi:hypothetical protein
VFRSSPIRSTSLNCAVLDALEHAAPPPPAVLLQLLQLFPACHQMCTWNSVPFRRESCNDWPSASWYNSRGKWSEKRHPRGMLAGHAYLDAYAGLNPAIVRSKRIHERQLLQLSVQKRAQYVVARIQSARSAVGSLHAFSVSTTIMVATVRGSGRPPRCVLWKHKLAGFKPAIVRSVSILSSD